MKTEDFDYELPEHLIAQRPLDKRDSSRLLFLQRTTGKVEHRNFRELPQLLPQPSLLVVNDTRVFPARLIGKRPTGGQVELLLLRRVEREAVSTTDQRIERWRCLGKPRRKLRLGSEIRFEDARGIVVAADAAGLTVDFEAPHGLSHVLEQSGRIPLPPYIRRPDDGLDRERYQTIFAGDEDGSVAAPTAGLHFTPEIVDALQAAGHQIASITLHVGPGTFLPVRAQRLEDHEMHGEMIEVSARTVATIARAKAQGRRVIAVGTTVVRALESSVNKRGDICATRRETELFIVPGHQFRVVEGLFTNFHLPKSTLLALVSAFANREVVLEAYRSAVRQEYRFYSYGDAMLIL